MSQLEKDLLKNAFFNAVGNGDTKEAQAALDKGLSVNVSNTNADGSALIHAICCDKPRMVEFLIAANINIDAPALRDGEPPLVLAVCLQRWEIAQKLIEAGADVNARDQKGNTALYYATGHPPTVKLLLAKDADVNIQSNHGATPLMNILRDRNHDVPPVVQSILARNPDLSLQDKDGNTALHYAVIHQSWAVIKTLIEAGADIEAENHKGFSAMDMEPGIVSAPEVKAKLKKMMVAQELEREIGNYSTGIKEDIEAPQRIMIRPRRPKP